MVSGNHQPPPRMKRGQCETCWRSGKIYYHTKCAYWLCNKCFNDKDESLCGGCAEKAKEFTQ